MPELPEVESVRLGLEKYRNQRLSKILIRDKSVLFEGQFSENKLNGKKLSSLKRRGKYLIFVFDHKYHLVAHLRMTGKFLPLTSTVIPKAVKDETSKKSLQCRAIFTFKEDVAFYDTRRFGTLTTVEDLELFFSKKKIAPDPIENQIQAQQHFFDKIQDRKQSIKAVLLDQSVVAGVGNIYADEALFLAKIHPKTMTKKIRNPEHLWEKIIDVFNLALRYGGSSIINYRDADGRSGTFQEKLNVYGRNGLACNICKRKIQMIYLAGRSTHFCKSCQGKN
ncbi:MAG: bifunctional DNA-formamidopyrimidine glycosylase/DNA-(apurinic or apyrimidinic site) lyase [Oligoflexia bacterium]|nr:bifunctional DNA-formamidopyrimidine glycosylase/DNA-(apurinic or apyrimidinic site) lyase [Oligoflexia bacterium]